MRFILVLALAPLFTQVAPTTRITIDAPEQIFLRPQTAAATTQPAPAERDDGTGRFYSVSNPMLFVWLPPAGRANGTAVIVCPGGSYDHVTMEMEGQRIARWFNPMGVAVFGLKYRTRPPSRDVAADALADGQRAMRLVRSHANEWKLDPKKIGMLGYSAGSNLVLNVSSHFDRGMAQSTDAIDQQSCRPDFVVMLSTWPNRLTIDAFPLSADSPPAFMAHARNDRTAPPEFADQIKKKLDEVKVPAELFWSETGGHGAFHIDERGANVEWKQALIDWMQKRDLIASK